MVSHAVLRSDDVHKSMDWAIIDLGNGMACLSLQCQAAVWNNTDIFNLMG